MTSTNKIIKYFAIGLAIFLGASIMYGIISFLYGIVVSVGLFDKNEDPEEGYKYNEYNNTISYLDIDLSYTNLIIETGDNLSVKTNNKNISINEDNNKLSVKENSRYHFYKNKLKELVISIPSDMEYQKVIIDSGAGEVHIEDMLVKQLNLDLGAGETIVKNIKAEESNIETGAGSVKILKSELHNLDLDLGVGEIEINGAITGNSKINSGIGAVNLNLDLKAEEYTFKLSKGIGEIKLNNQTISNDETIGTGENYLDIDGGIGEIKIQTK